MKRCPLCYKRECGDKARACADCHRILRNWRRRAATMKRKMGTPNKAIVETDTNQ
jgi:hypothetical protein